MKSTVKGYNLSGMGCSAGIIAIDLAKDLLRVYPNTRCLVFSTENITQNWYLGNDRSMLLSNCLFRMGGAAMLLSNRFRDGFRSKYQLLHTVRVHHGASDTAFESVVQREDADGVVGVSLSKDLINVVSKALRANLTELGPLILPWSEQIKFLANHLQRRFEWYGAVSSSLSSSSSSSSSKHHYTPNFKKAVDHICIHAGGRAVIDGLEQSLQLTARDVEPSRAVLRRYGNTSSSSIWYELAYMEHGGLIRKNQKIWQIAFGSGFKCNSAVWRALKNVTDHARGDWDLEDA